MWKAKKEPAGHQELMWSNREKLAPPSLPGTYLQLTFLMVFDLFQAQVELFNLSSGLKTILKKY